MRLHSGCRLLLLSALAGATLAAPDARADDDFEPNDTLASARFLGGPLRDPAEASNLLSAEAVLEAGDARDFYSFTAFAGAPIAIRVEPLAGAGGAADERNLLLRLWRRTSAQTQTFEIFAQIDFNAAGFAEYHPPIPYAAAGFMAVEIAAPDGADGEQPYRLRIANQALEASIAPELVLLNGLEGVADGGSVSFGDVALGERASVVLSVQNEGDAILRLDPPALSGAAAPEYEIELSSDTIQPGGFAALAIDFEPGVLGEREAGLDLSSNDPAQPELSIGLRGAGVETAPPTLELQLALPRLSALSLAPEIEGVAVPIALELALDPSGRPVCAGACSVAGEAVRVEAQPLKRTGSGGWIYRLKLFGTLSARFAKLRGELGSGIATMRLAGPEGAAKLTGVGVAESLEPDATTRLRFFPQPASGGGLAGSGAIESGLGNDAGAPLAKLTGSVSETQLVFELKSKALRRRIAFRGARQGDLYVGKLSYRIPPAKGKLLDQAVPAALLGEP